MNPINSLTKAEGCGFDVMKRLITILVVMGLVCFFEGIDPAFARSHRDAPLGGFSLWQIFIGVIFLVVMFSIFAGGGKDSQAVIDASKKNKERVEREKKEKGLLKYYGEGIGMVVIFACALPILALILGAINWLFS